MRKLISRLFGWSDEDADRTAPPPASSAEKPPSVEFVGQLRAIAQRYRDLRSASSDPESRITFGELAAEYDARADRIELASFRLIE